MDRLLFPCRDSQAASIASVLLNGWDWEGVELEDVHHRPAQTP